VCNGERNKEVRKTKIKNEREKKEICSKVINEINRRYSLKRIRKNVHVKKEKKEKKKKK
jgi:hypothetical protein